MLSERSQLVFNAFSRYVKRGDKSFEPISREEIERALAEFARDKGHPAYVAMEQRIQELKEIEIRKIEEQGKIEDRRKSKREKWMDRGISFASGIAITILGVLIKSCLEKK